MLRDGYVVISDRYNLSSLAYQAITASDDGRDHGDTLRWIRELNPARRPDVTLVLDVTPDVAEQRRRRRGGATELFDHTISRRGSPPPTAARRSSCPATGSCTSMGAATPRVLPRDRAALAPFVERSRAARVVPTYGQAAFEISMSSTFQPDTDRRRRPSRSRSRTSPAGSRSCNG